jgi:hypothetical protein
MTSGEVETRGDRYWLCCLNEEEEENRMRKLARDRNHRRLLIHNLVLLDAGDESVPGGVLLSELLEALEHPVEPVVPVHLDRDVWPLSLPDQLGQVGNELLDVGVLVGRRSEGDLVPHRIVTPERGGQPGSAAEGGRKEKARESAFHLRLETGIVRD